MARRMFVRLASSSTRVLAGNVRYIPEAFVHALAAESKGTDFPLLRMTRCLSYLHTGRRTRCHECQDTTSPILLIRYHACDK
ncbi:hypothetical protein F4808DRAFT_357432 [Astrocystis sublimbata]|nr:hypothetical protein F4808DRAFT_357432 [Astrocystis sublimbata]